MISVCLTDPRASGGVFIIPHMLHAHAHSHVHVIVYVCVWLWMSVPIFLKPHGFFVFNPFPATEIRRALRPFADRPFIARASSVGCQRDLRALKPSCHTQDARC